MFVDILTDMDVTADADAIACCAPLAASTLSDEEAAATAELFKALGDPARVRILNLIALSGGEVCACDLNEPVGLAQPTVSHHLKKLVDAGLLEREQRGKWAFFSLQPRRRREARGRRRPEGSVLLMTTTGQTNCARRCAAATPSRRGRSAKDRPEAAASGSCCADGESDAGKFGEALYDAEQRGELPEAAALASLGCGNPIMVADLHEGETVLDLGSGGGIDVILSAKRVGETGLASDST